MRALSRIDPNFKVQNGISLRDVRFYNVKENSFCLSGLSFDEKGFYRMPEREAKKVSDGVAGLCRNTSGGRLRFVTDSPYVALSVRMPSRPISPHLSAMGCMGFDLYRDGEYAGIRTLSCEAQLEKNRVLVKHIPAFGFAAVEISL